jgi:hypothetical protein
VPALFVLTSLLLAVGTIVSRPVQSLAGLGVLALGIPAYLWWSRRPAEGKGGTR